MRELPEPDIQPQEAFDMGLEELPYFAEKSVLAIQRQAYEDGLRDAAEKIEAFDCWLPTDTAGNVIREMITASQKEEK